MGFILYSLNSNTIDDAIVDEYFQMIVRFIQQVSQAKLISKLSI